MQWVSSGGGPLVLLPLRLRALWGGCVSSYTGIYYLSEDGGYVGSDYDRACAIPGTVGVLGVGEGECVVFGNEQSQATWVVDEKLQYLLVRWLYADSDEQVFAVLQGLTSEDFEPSEMRFRNTDSELILFDSAAPGIRVSPTKSLVLNLPPGEYSIRTGLVVKNEKTALLIHHFAGPHT